MSADLERLKHFPMIEAIRLEAARQIVHPVLSGSSPQQLREHIARLPIDIGTSLLLGALAGETRFGGLPVYFLASMRGALASDIADALGRAGLDDQKAIFLQAVSAANKVYPAGVPPGFSANENIEALTELGTHLQTLGQRFDACGDFGGQIERFVQSRPDALDYFEKIRRGTSPDDRLRWLDVELIRLDMPRTGEAYFAALTALPKPYRHLLVTALFEGELLNGGVDQFFTNSTGALGPAVVEAFRDMGMVEYADLFQQGIDLLGTPYPFDPELRFERMESAPGFKDFEERFTLKFDRWDKDGTFSAGRLRYTQVQGILPQ